MNGFLHRKNFARNNNLPWNEGAASDSCLAENDESIWRIFDKCRQGAGVASPYNKMTLQCRVCVHLMIQVFFEWQNASKEALKVIKTSKQAFRLLQNAENIRGYLVAITLMSSRQRGHEMVPRWNRMNTTKSRQMLPVPTILFCHCDNLKSRLNGDSASCKTYSIPTGVFRVKPRY